MDDPTYPSAGELAQLSDLLDVLREHGVTEFTAGSLHLVLGSLPEAESVVSPEAARSMRPVDVSEYKGPDMYRRAFGGNPPEFDR